MLHTKRLAYQSGKETERPRHIKNLFFGALCGAALTTFISCAHADSMSKAGTTAPKKEMPAWVFGKAKDESVKGKCGAAASVLTSEGRKAVKSICTESFEYVLTAEDIFIFPREKQNDMDADQVSVTFSYMKLGVANILKPGVVDWEATDAGAYLMLRDNTLVVVLRERAGPELPTYNLNFDAASMGTERMASVGGYLVLAAPDGDLQFLKDGKWCARPSGISEPDAGLHKTGNKLFFGKKDGADVEIIIDEDGPWVAAPRK